MSEISDDLTPNPDPAGKLAAFLDEYEALCLRHGCILDADLEGNVWAVVSVPDKLVRTAPRSLQGFCLVTWEKQ